MVLHRDVKSANIGLTRVGGPTGGLYAKVLDCGLARALKGKDGAATEGRSITGGVVGTLGYMAPELGSGKYSQLSDIYALGCVLLELLSGARVGATTVRKLEEEAIEEEGGVAVVSARAEACWSRPAADALAVLTLRCIHHSARKRPPNMGEVLRELKALRVLVEPTAAPLANCAPCQEDVPEGSGVRCGGAGRHFSCHGCFQGHIINKLQLAVLRGNNGNIPCYDQGQGCNHTWKVEELQDHLDKGTLVACFVAVRQIGIDGPRAAEALAAAQDAALAAASQLKLEERVQALRKVIVERDLNLRCPSCAQVFDDYSGCNCLTCENCGARFCAVCLKNCGSGRETHEHHGEAHGDYFDRGLFDTATKTRYVDRLCSAVRAEEKGGVELQIQLVAELAKADLGPLGISEQEILQGAGVTVLIILIITITLIVI